MTGVVDKKSVAVLLDKNLGVLPTLFASVTTHRRWQNETVAPRVKNTCERNPALVVAHTGQ